MSELTTWTDDLEEILKSEGPSELPVEEDIDTDIETEENEETSEEEASDEEDEEAEEEEASNEVSELKSTVAQLTGIVKDLLANRNNPSSEEKPVAESFVPKKLDIESFIGTDEDINDILTDPEKFNSILNKVANRSYQKAVEDTRQSIRTELPTIIQKEQSMRSNMARTADRFWSENSHLLSGASTEQAKADRKSTVAYIANQVSSESPGIALNDLFKETVRRAETMFGVNNAQNRSANRRKTRMAKVKSSGNPAKGAKVDKENSKAKEVEETIRLMGLNV